MTKITDRYEPKERVEVEPVMELLNHCEMLRLTCIMLIDFIKNTVTKITTNDETNEHISHETFKLLKELGEI